MQWTFGVCDDFELINPSKLASYCMSHGINQPPSDNDSTSYFWSVELIRSRSVSNTVLTGALNILPAPLWLTSEWDQEISKNLGLEVGDVEPLPITRTRTRWADYRTCLQQATQWTQSQGLSNAFTNSDMALMACRAARYHHDAVLYGDKAFFNLFLSEDRGLDLHFPHTGQRIPLMRGKVVLFDTAQPHGVIQRGSSRFDVANFPDDRDVTQVFLSWELPIEHAEIRQALQITIDDPSVTSDASELLTEQQLWRAGVPAVVCPQSGQWINAQGRSMESGK